MTDEEEDLSHEKLCGLLAYTSHPSGWWDNGSWPGKSIATHEPDSLLGSSEISPLKVVALSSQPCKHSTDCPQAWATTCAWGMENFTSKNLYPQGTSPESYMLELYLTSTQYQFLGTNLVLESLGILL